MEITFDSMYRDYDTRRRVISFQAYKGKTLIECEIDAQALMDCFGAQNNKADCLAVFEANVATIEAEVRRQINAGQEEVFLNGTHFSNAGGGQSH